MSLLPLTSIILEDRQRRDLGDIDGLAESIRTHGLIQPIVIDQNNRLIAGGRRYAAHQKLGLQEIDVTYLETLSEFQRKELEYEENIRRKDFTWQERALAIAGMHRLHTIKSIEDGSAWGQKETGELLNVSAAHVNYTLEFARRLADPKHSWWSLESPSEALREILKEREDIALAELARRNIQAPIASKILEEQYNGDVVMEQFNTDEDKALDLARYLSNPHNPPEDFEAYWAEKNKPFVPVVPLYNNLYHGDCLRYMFERENTFDHIITDPPYGIDMSMLDDGMTDIDSVADEHNVEENLFLLAKFFPIAFLTLKETGFLTLWCDYTHWSYLSAQATNAGFRVQRWPIVWVKTSTCKNSAPQYNFTKSTEICMVCRKGNATMIKPSPLGHIIAPHDEFRAKMNHPFVKPYAAWRFLLEHLTLEGQKILDPFCGEGSAIISMQRMGRKPFGCEINEQHYNRLIENMQAFI